MPWPFLLILGLACTFGGAAWCLKRWKLRREAVRTEGIVIELSVGVDIPQTSWPIIEFTAEAGQTIRFRGSTGSTSSPYRPGQLVSVIYSRKNPSNAQIDNFEQFWLGPVSIVLFGLITLGAFLLFGEL